MKKKKKATKVKVSKTYDDDQLHPDGTTGADVIPDTHDHTDVALTTRGPGCGETHYIPGDGFLISHGGFSNRSKASVYDDKVKQIRKARGDTAKRRLPQGGTYLSEGEILGYAAAIHAHRRMTGAKSVKEQIFEEAKARAHPGTDAVDGAKDGIHTQSDSFNLDRSRSTIFIGLAQCGGGGMLLNGSKVRHSNIVNIVVCGPDGRRICEVIASPEQFAAALFGNSHTPCTLNSYMSLTDDSVRLTERVRPPVSIRKRMAKRLKHRLGEQADALRKVAQEMEDQAASGKPARKTMLRDFAERVGRATEYTEANAAFTIQQAQEEISATVEAAGIQFIGQQTLDPKALWAAAGPALGLDDEMPALGMEVPALGMADEEEDE